MGKTLSWMALLKIADEKLPPSQTQRSSLEIYLSIYPPACLPEARPSVRPSVLPSILSFFLPPNHPSSILIYQIYLSVNLIYLSFSVILCTGLVRQDTLTAPPSDFDDNDDDDDNDDYYSCWDWRSHHCRYLSTWLLLFVVRYVHWNSQQVILCVGLCTHSPEWRVTLLTWSVNRDTFLLAYR